MDNSHRRALATLWTLLAAGFALGVLVYTFRGLEIDALFDVVDGSDLFWVSVLILVMPTEQWVRGWKWRQILFDIHPVNTIVLFGAVMAGYFANMVVPVGVSPFVRAWVVARKNALKISTVLLTTAIERFVDGIVFALIVGALVFFYVPPAIEGNLRVGLTVAGAGSFIIFTGLMAISFYLKTNLKRQNSRFAQLSIKLEKRFSKHLGGMVDGIAQGITWPSAPIRGIGVVSASFLMKAISATHFLWAGLAFGITLAPLDYVFIMVFSGFTMIMTRFVRIPGGGVIGSAFALKLLEIPGEEALLMVALVHAVSIATTVLFGAPVLWYSGLKLSSLKNKQAG